MAAHIQYTQELNEKFGYLATWVPNATVKLGDVGVIEGRVFSLSTTLARLGINFESRDSTGLADYEHVSSNAVSVSVKVAGQAPPPGSGLALGEAGLHIRFQNENGIVFSATQCVESSVLGVDELGREIIRRSENGEWPLNQVVVTTVIRAASATVLISAGSDAEIDLVCESAVEAASIRLASVEGKLRVARSTKLGTKIIANASLTPLFRASGLFKPLFRGPRFEQRRGESTGIEPIGPGPTLRFAEIGDYADLD